MADTDQVLNLAAIIRKVDGSNNKGAAALAESILDHPRFRAALADEPAVPEGKKPTRDELWELWLRLNNELPDRPAAVAEFWEHAQIDARARAALADEPVVPAPPADGEVAELAEMLKGIAYWRLHGTDKPTPFDIRQAARLTRAAELLERQVPVPVSERLPGPKDCDAEGRCWWGTPSFVNRFVNRSSVTQSAQWRLSAPDDRFGSELFWCPAHALPLPEVGE